MPNQASRRSKDIRFHTGKSTVHTGLMRRQNLVPRLIGTFARRRGSAVEAWFSRSFGNCQDTIWRRAMEIRTNVKAGGFATSPLGVCADTQRMVDLRARMYPIRQY